MGSSPVISTPSVGHEHVPEVCRIHSAIPAGGIMTSSRLHLPGPTRSSRRRISIGLLAVEDVKGGFGQMARHGAHRPAGSFAQPQAEVELADVPVRAAGDLITADPEPRKPEEAGELVEVHPEEAGGHLTLKIPLLYSQVLYQQLPDTGVGTRMGSHVTCTKGQTVSCWMDIDPKQASLFPMKGRN